MTNNLLEAVVDALDSWLGPGAKAKLMRNVHSLVSAGEKLDLTQMHKRMNVPFFNALRIFAVLVVFPVAGIFLLDAYGLEPSVPMKLLFMSSIVGSCAPLWRALAIRFREVEFQKDPLDDRLHAFLSDSRGRKLLWDLSNQSPEIQKFMKANKMYEAFSTFEYELVESFWREQANITPFGQGTTP